MLSSRWLSARERGVFPAPAGPMISTDRGVLTTTASSVSLFFKVLSQIKRSHQERAWLQMFWCWTESNRSFAHILRRAVP